MPAFEALEACEPSGSTTSDAEVQFPPVTRDHILRCSYDSWFPRYRASCIKSRIIQLPAEFIEYIREDGIILSSDGGNYNAEDDDDWKPTSTSDSRPPPPEDDEESESDEEDVPAPPRLPPDQRFPALHQTIKDRIKELGGAVVPKLNWSAPKDATWISPHQNTLKCTRPDDIYLLLKSSSFVSHDLEHAFDGTVATASTAHATVSPSSASSLGFQPVLVLRPFSPLHQALEFRCFVKQRSLVAIAQRDLNYYAFLKSLRPAIIARAKDLFDEKLRFTFPDGNFSFDVYIPEAHGNANDSSGDENSSERSRLGKARLIDINPWAPRTDTLLFDWKELLELRVPRPMLGGLSSSDVAGSVVVEPPEPSEAEDDDTTTSDEDGDDYEPELRLVEKDDPQSYNFSSPQYSAHKLPREVVDASMAGEGGLREFAQQWARMMERR